jgi:protein-disulfide isomerase
MRFRKAGIRRMRFFIAIVTMVLFVSVAAEDEVTLGDSGAPVTIVEYGSLTCDYCVRFHREVLPLIHSRHIETGLVRFVYRDFPTSPAAIRGAIAARCAGPENYYTMLDALYGSVGDWSKARDIDTALIRHADSLSIDAVVFRACLEDPAHVASIREGRRQATSEYGVRGTPTFLINGEIVRGIKTIDEMELLIAAAMQDTP